MSGSQLEGTESGFHVGSSSKWVIAILIVVSLFNTYFTFKNYRHLITKEANQPYETIIKSTGRIQASIHLHLYDSIPHQVYYLNSMYYGEMLLLETDVRKKLIIYRNNLEVYRDSIVSRDLSWEKEKYIDKISQDLVKACMEAMH